MNTKGKRLVAAMLSLVMVLGIFAAVPFGASAWGHSTNANNSDSVAVGTGTSLPEGAEVYDGVLSETLEGEGTAEAPFLINDAKDFMYFLNSKAASAVAGECYKLMGNVYMNTADYGEQNKHNAMSETPPDFAGNLDGNGFTIYNLYSYVTTTENRYIALFKTVSGEVKNLNFDGVRMRSIWTDQERHRLVALLY